MTWLRVKLAARAISRMGGGSGLWGAFVGNHRIMMLMIALIAIYMTIVGIASFPEMQACLDTNQSHNCVTTMAEATVRDASGFIIFLAVLCVGLSCVLGLVVKPIAESLTITPELETLAAAGVPEAAQTLAELHDERGATAHAHMWREKAAALGHPAAKKQLKRLAG